MKWSELVREVARRSDVPEATARRVLRQLSETVVEAVAAGERVVVADLGTFESTWRAQRVLRAVHSGRKMAIDGRYAARFRPAARLRDALRGLAPQFLREPEHQQAWRLAEALVGDLGLYHRASVPTGILPGDDPDVVEASCRRAFGPQWSRVRETFDRQTPAEVRKARDYLVLAARRRWAS